jgi:prepilin-type N-terminal cleavage/methylation domain-containing protein
MHKLVKQAFTLIELLVVIAIIGILSGLIIVSMGGVTQKATIAKAQVFSNSLRNALMLNLVSEWKFDGLGVSDGSTATTAYTQDSWSGGNNCTIVGTPTVYSGSNCINGSCLKFNGSTDYLNCGSGANLRNHTSESIFVWVNLSAYTATYRTIVDTGYWNASYGTLINPNPNVNTVLIALKNSTGTTASESISFNPNTWMYIGFSWDGSTITYYKDGVSYGTPDSFSGTMTNNGNNLFIGGSPGTYFFGGLIDEVRIYNAARPTSQIKEQYYAGLNNLLAKGGITNEEYQNRIGELAVVQP